MFKNYFKGIDGIQAYPMFLLFAFLLFFIGLLFYLYRADLFHMNAMGNLPLEDGSLDSSDEKPKNNCL